MKRDAPKGLAFFVMPGNALKSLSDELYIDMGEEKTVDALYRFGYRCGENMARDLDIHCDTPGDMKEILPVLIIETGLGQAVVTSSRNELNVVFEDSLEALMCAKKGSCSFTRGYLAGITSSILGNEFVCREVECLSLKHKRCNFHIRLGTGEVIPRAETSSKLSRLENVITARLDSGCSYLIEEEAPRKSYDIFVKHLAKGFDGLCITREFPDKIRKQYSLKTTPILWLTRTGKEGCIGPEKLSELYHKINNFLIASKKGIIMLSGLEYLISQNSFSSVLKFVQLLRDQIAIHGSVLLAPISPLTVEERELKLIEREFEIIRT